MLSQSNDIHKTAYLGGGCFWGMEDLFRKQPGVIDTEVGYAGGENDNPTYENHPGHAETLAVTYDPTQTSFENLLDYFFRIHNPTTKDRQGNDVGTSYRSVIFYQDENERQAAESMIARVDCFRTLGKPRGDESRALYGLLFRRRLPPGLPRKASRRIYVSFGMVWKLSRINSPPEIAFWLPPRYDRQEIFLFTTTNLALYDVPA